MDERYLPPCNGGRWAIGREIMGRWIHLIQDTAVYDPADVEVVLMALRIPPVPVNIEVYFPILEGKDGRCPTLELLELFSRLSGGIGKEVGV